MQRLSPTQVNNNRVEVVVKRGIFVGLLTAGVCLGNGFAWDGYDNEKGASIEIEKGNLVRTGETIEIYDYGEGSYKNVDVESISRTGNTVELEVYDHDSGEYRTFEMEDNQ